MPRPTGLFDSFDNLDKIPIEAISVWLKPVPQIVSLENYLANKILYPQTIPTTPYAMEIDMAILREALKTNESKFLDKKLRKILVPGRFLYFVPDLTTLSWVFVDAFLLGKQKEDWREDVWTMVLTGEMEEAVGTVLLPRFDSLQGVMNLQFQGKDYQIHSGKGMIIPCPKDRCEIAYKFQDGLFLGKKESAVEVYGGKLGLIIDGRSI